LQDELGEGAERRRRAQWAVCVMGHRERHAIT
jgi:hypothetical protein